MAITNILTTVESVSNSITFIHARHIEESVRAGENAMMTALIQLGQSLTASVNYIDRALDVAGMDTIPWAGHAVIHLTPFLFGIAKDYDLIPEPLRPACVFVHNHISILYETAAVVSSIVLIFFGHSLYGGISLVILGIGIMDRQGWFPPEVRQAIHKYTEPVQIIAALIGGGIIDRLVAMGHIASLAAYTYVNFFQQKIPNEQLVSNNLTLQIMQDFFHNRVRFAVNPKHIHRQLMPQIPDVDIAILLEQFDQMYRNPSDKTILTLRKKCQNDKRFITEHGHPDRIKDDQRIIAIVRDNLADFIDSVKMRRILKGEPRDYETMHNYLKLLTSYNQRQTNEIVKIDILNSMAVDGGKYCGPGKFEAAESLFAQIMSQEVEMPIVEKILHCLQDERNRWMQAFYAETQRLNPLIRLLDWQDIHIYNIFLNCYGDAFGLRKTAAENDDSAIVDALAKCLISWLLQGILEEGFWGDHQLENLNQTLLEVAGTNRLPFGKLYDFWIGWIDRQHIDAEQKRTLTDELKLEHSLLGEPLLIDNRFNPQFISLMLFDIGIAQLETPAMRAAVKPLGLSILWKV